jgi:hypothetical protein
MNRNNCVMGLRLCAPVEAIRRMQRVWEVFALTTHATATSLAGDLGAPSSLAPLAGLP